MKRVNLVVYLLLISLILSSCSNPTSDSTEKIVPPKNQLMSIKGTWEISKVLNAESLNEDNEQWLGKKVQFSNTYMSVGYHIVKKPEYQMKRVNSEEYLLFNSKSLPKNFQFPNKEVEVITVIDEDKFFCEVLIIKEDELILKIQSNSVYLNKISDKADEYTFSENDNKKNEGINIEADEEDSSYTGVLLGLRSINENSSSQSESIEDYNYRSLWISSKNNEINPILELDHIIFPRRSGFWKIEMKNAITENKEEEYIAASNISVEDNKAELKLKSKIMDIQIQSINNADEVNEVDFSKWEQKTGKIKRKINYVGNDYISIETKGEGKYIVGNETWEKSKLQLIPIDALPNVGGVKISDILEIPGVTAMRSAWERTMNYFKINPSDILYREELIENFGLERKLGHWFLKGRINYTKNKEFNTVDYSISLIPPAKVVVYDTLFVPWTNIKDKVPMALDVYTSPNKDIAIVVTKNKLLIYDIVGNRLSNYPKLKIDLKEGETVIMAEWSVGQYVDNWDKTLKNYSEKK